MLNRKNESGAALLLVMLVIGVVGIMMAGMKVYDIQHVRANVIRSGAAENSAIRAAFTNFYNDTGNWPDAVNNCAGAWAVLQAAAPPYISGPAQNRFGNALTFQCIAADAQIIQNVPANLADRYAQSVGGARVTNALNGTISVQIDVPGTQPALVGALTLNNLRPMTGDFDGGGNQLNNVGALNGQDANATLFRVAGTATATNSVTTSALKDAANATFAVTTGLLSEDVTVNRFMLDTPQVEGDLCVAGHIARNAANDVLTCKSNAWTSAEGGFAMREVAARYLIQGDTRNLGFRWFNIGDTVGDGSAVQVYVSCSIRQDSAEIFVLDREGRLNTILRARSTGERDYVMESNTAWRSLPDGWIGIWGSGRCDGNEGLNVAITGVM